MDCLTNYRDGGNLHSRSNGTPNSLALYNDILYGCGVKPAVRTSTKCTGPMQMDSYEWSRLGPMGYLLEPKLFPTNVCSTSCPTENHIETRNLQRTMDEECGQPSTIEPISPLPPADILRRINEDRLRSTYQTDFGDMDDYPWVDYDKLMISAGYKTGSVLLNPREVIKCRERPKPPYLNGHEIPGRRPKDSSVYTSFGTMSKKTNRHSGPQDTNLPPRPVIPKRVTQRSKKIYDDDHHESDRKTNFGDVSADGRRQILKDASGNERSSSSVSPIDDNERLKSKNAIGNDKEQITGHLANNRRTQIIGGPQREDSNRISENVAGYKGRIVTGGGVDDNRRKLYGEPTDDNSRLTPGDNRGTIGVTSTNNAGQKAIDKQTLDTKKSAVRDTRKSRKDTMPSAGKIKEHSEELELIPPTSWTSEYQDVISRTATDILRSKLHYYGKMRLITPNPDCP